MTRDAPLITVLEDSHEIRELLVTALEAQGFRTRSFGRAADFERDLRRTIPDLSIIDLGLPDRDGLAMVNAVSSETGAPVLIISGRSNTQDKIVGLELGADDYMTKPFEVPELVARVRALLRRAKPQPKASERSRRFRFGGWQVDLEQHLMTSDDGTQRRLSHAEGQLLGIFLNRPNRLVTREHIIESTGGGQGESYDRAIDVRVSRLRAKLGDDPNDPRIIKTIYGAGYIFIADIAEEAGD